jgi:DNA replication licensing factor MCM3
MHRYLPPGVEEGTPILDNLSQSLSVEGPGLANSESETTETSPFEKFDPLLHIGFNRLSSTRKSSKKNKEILSIAFIKKYIQYAKSKPAPVLTKGAADLIISCYVNLRNEDQERNVKKVLYISNGILV